MMLRFEGRTMWLGYDKEAGKDEHRDEQDGKAGKKKVSEAASIQNEKFFLRYHRR